MVSQSRIILPGLESEMVEDCLVYITQMGLGGSSNLHADSLSFTFTWCDLFLSPGFALTGHEFDAVPGGGAVDRRALVRLAVVVVAVAVPVRPVAPQRRATWSAEQICGK